MPPIGANGKKVGAVMTDLINITLRAGDIVRFMYKNHRGQTRARTVSFIGLDYGSDEWYREPQFRLRGVDMENDNERSFAMNNIVGGINIERFTSRNVCAHCGKLKTEHSSTCPVKPQSYDAPYGRHTNGEPKQLEDLD